MNRHLAFLIASTTFAAVVASSFGVRVAYARQPEEQPAPIPKTPASPDPADPVPDTEASPLPRPTAPPVYPDPEPPPPPPPRPAPAEIPEGPAPMSEGRLLSSLYNSGFQWGISPGIVFANGKTGFALGLHFGYGVDTGPVILVPGLRLTGYFTDPNVYVAMPTFKLVLPIDRFAPFIEGGLGIGHVTSDSAGGVDIPAKSGLAVMGGGGFMIYFRHFAFGAEASYQVITGTGFKGFGIGPILAIGF